LKSPYDDGYGGNIGHLDELRLLSNQYDRAVTSVRGFWVPECSA
jgi:hypothetical protein